MKENNINNSMADLALQWLWNQKEISVVLSGMSTMEQVKENILSATFSAVNSLTLDEIDIIEEIAEKMRGPVSCTRCAYCMPCPNGVNIPENFYLYNTAKLFDNFEDNQKRYHEMEEDNRAVNCIKCAQCEELCPQNLPIMNLLEEVAAYFNG